MKKLRLAAVAAIMGAAALFAGAPAQASAYPDVVVVLTADSPVIGGKTVNFSVTTTAGTIECDWTVTWSDGVASGENDTRTSSGRPTSFSGSFESKVVSSSTPTTMTATCVYDDAQIAQNATPDSVTVVLLPRGGDDDDDDNGALPDTGGSNLAWLFIGGALVLAGGGVTYAARRRQSVR